MKPVIRVFEAVVGSKARPPCLPPAQQGWAYGAYFGFESEAARNAGIADFGGSPAFDLYTAHGLFWAIYRAGVGGPTPYGFEQRGFEVVSWPVQPEPAESGGTRAYLRGCSSIQAPVDMHGNPINVGDRLSWDFGDYHEGANVEAWMREPTFVVELHSSGRGLCAVGIAKTLYLHDFRFKFCERIAD